MRLFQSVIHLIKQLFPLQNRSVSMVDMYIDNTEPSENVGQIHFSLEYDFQNTTLILKVIQVSFSFKWSLNKENLAWKLTAFESNFHSAERRDN